jgi:membrane associated rhomboid family serine protease
MIELHCATFEQDRCMIAIPLTKNFSWRNPPLMTIGLILINCFIFIAFQHNDDRYWAEANQFYFDSGLAKLEIQLYRIYLESKNNTASENRGAIPGGSDNDAHFLKRLKNGGVVPETDPRLARWQRLRSEYTARLNRVVAYKYGFKPASPRPFTWLSSMFLHGGWGHLIGNMIFLWLIGCLIEYGCRHITFPIIYLLGGMGGSAFFWLLNSNSTIPSLGASGAIAGIMGAFTVFYGLKKVRIFINLGFYFNYLKFSAIFLLPLWMASQLLQMLFDTLSPVAYAAHLGGLGCGAVLALIARHIPGSLQEDAFEAAEEDKVAPLLEHALAHMGALNFSAARGLLEQALEHDPDNITVRQHLYTIDRQHPEKSRYHLTASELLARLCLQPDHFDRACSLFQDYIKTAKPPKLSGDQYITISQCFIATGRLQDAQRIIFSLVKKAPRLSGLPMAMFKLSQEFRRAQQKIEWTRCLEALRHYFPMSNEAQFALEQLKRVE